jgi:hypothetical protein
MVNRKHVALQHPKLKECIVADFMQLDSIKELLTGYDACLFCAGISSNGLSEAEYTHITYDITIHFAETLLTINPSMIFSFVSGSHTDSSEKGKLMWARVKGKTENALSRMPFKNVYHFRPGLMKPSEGQVNVKPFYKVITSMYPLFKLIFPNNVSTMRELGLAMINSVLKGYASPILEVKDIKELGK